MKSAGVIAATFGWDVSEVTESRYQSTRTAFAVYACGDNYYCCARRKPKDGDGFVWHMYRDQFFAAQNNTVMWESTYNGDDE